MFPLRDENQHPAGFKPIVTYMLILVNVAVFFYEAISIGQFFDFTNQNALNLFYEFGAIPDCVLGASSIKVNIGHSSSIVVSCPSAAYVMLFSSIFLHGGIMHLGGNMLFLWIFGDNIELKFGKIRYLLVYFTWGISAGLIHIIGDPHSTIPAIGASGAISGILGAYLVIFPKARITTFMMWGFFWRTMHIQAKLFLPFWLVFQNLLPLFVGGFGIANDGVAYLAHVGGFITGIIIGYIYKITHNSEFMFGTRN